jgi:ribonuclease VapC
LKPYTPKEILCQEMGFAMALNITAIIAVVFQEPGYERILQRITGEQEIGIGTPTLAETGIVLTARLGHRARTVLAGFLQELGVTQVPFGEVHWQGAVAVYEKFGRVRHPAKLNFGDCLSYATAKLAGQPLLHTGSDFNQTDLEEA